jgi:uncharacterized protein YraI
LRSEEDSLMQQAIKGGLIVGLTLWAIAMGGVAKAEPSGFYEVVGVSDNDMLKLRAGPGVGYKVVVGLPNGTVVWLRDCQRSGNTSWCRVALKEARGLKGYVSGNYLRRVKG